MLDTAFERVVGDVGNPDSYPMPVRLKVVEGAGSTQIVRADRPDAALVSSFIDAAVALQADGACGIISSCGFLVRLQAEISSRVTIPVILSALSLGKLAESATGRRRCGIITADAEALDSGALASAGLHPGCNPIVDMSRSDEFRRTILASKELQKRSFDRAQMEADAVEAAQALKLHNPDIGSIVLECGNLPPYKNAIRRTTGLPVFSILDPADLIWRTQTSAY